MVLITPTITKKEHRMTDQATNAAEVRGRLAEAFAVDNSAASPAERRLQHQLASFVPDNQMEEALRLLEEDSAEFESLPATTKMAVGMYAELKRRAAA
jgi:hypothetical protein